MEPPASVKSHDAFHFVEPLATIAGGVGGAPAVGARREFYDLNCHPTTSKMTKKDGVVNYFAKIADEHLKNIHHIDEPKEINYKEIDR